MADNKPAQKAKAKAPTVATKPVHVGTKDKKMEFEVSQPYAEGHTLTAVEAKVLNQVRGENVCNNMRAKVQATMAGKDDALSEAALRTAFAEYDVNYVFTEAAVAAAGKSPLEKETLKIARTLAGQLFKQKNIKRKDVKEEQWDKAVAHFAGQEKVQKIAQRRLDEQSDLFDSELAEAT